MIRSNIKNGYEHNELWDKNKVQQCRIFLDDETYKRIVADFFEKNNRVDVLLEAIKNSDKALILRECHSLKGATSMIGLIAFNEVINVIEQSLRSEIPLDAEMITNALNQLLKISEKTFLKFYLLKE